MTRRPPPEPVITQQRASDKFEIDITVEAPMDDDFANDRPTMVPDVPPHMELDPRQLVSDAPELPKTLPPPSGPRIEVSESSLDEDLGPLVHSTGNLTLDSVPPLPPPPARITDVFSEGPDDFVDLPPPRSQAPTLVEADALQFDLKLPTNDRVARSLIETQPAAPASLGPVTMRAPPAGGESIDHALEQLAAHRGARDVDLDDDVPASGDMRDRFALGDYSGALLAAEGILAASPDSAEAARVADECRDKLRQMFASKLGSLTGVPRVVLAPDQVRWLSLDHKAGFILSCIDGYSTIEEILDVSGMPTLDALRVLYELQQQRVIAVS